MGFHIPKIPLIKLFLKSVGLWSEEKNSKKYSILHYFSIFKPTCEKHQFNLHEESIQRKNKELLFTFDKKK